MKQEKSPRDEAILSLRRGASIFLCQWTITSVGNDVTMEKKTVVAG